VEARTRISGVGSERTRTEDLKQRKSQGRLATMMTTRRLAGLFGLAIMLGAVYFVAYAATITCPTTGAPCVGTNLSDTFVLGGANAHSLFGLGGNDIIPDGTANANSLFGGPGDDTITLSGAAVKTVFGEDGNDFIAVSAGISAGSSLDGGRGNDNITFTSAPAGAITIYDGPGVDTISSTVDFPSGVTIVMAGDNEPDRVLLNEGATGTHPIIILNMNSGRDIISCNPAAPSDGIVVLNGNYKAVDPFGNNLRQAALLGGTAQTNCNQILP